MRRVRLLLLSLHDYLPSPPHVMLKAPSGPAPSRYVPCEPCAEQGFVVYRGRRRHCFTCQGTGLRRRRSGDPEWCAYTRMLVSEARALIEAQQQQPRVVAVPAQEREQAFAWERRQAVYHANGSYQALQLALRRMQTVFPAGFHLIERIYISEVLPRDHDPDLEGRALVWLAAAMPRVRVPRWVKQTGPPDSRQLVLELAQQGHGAGVIAKKVGLPKVTVKRYLRATVRRVCVPDGA